MKVLLVGGAGFIGKRLAVSLLKAGHDVRALFRKAQSEAPAGDFRIEWLQLDLLDPDYDLDTAIAGCSVIFNCAGELHGVERPFFRLPEMLVRAFALGGGWLKGFPLTQVRVDSLVGRTHYECQKLRAVLGYWPRRAIPDYLGEVFSHSYIMGQADT